MKKIIILALTALMMVGCDTITEEQRYSDYLQEQNEIKGRIKDLNSVIIIDHCEYIVKTIDSHKGHQNATQSGYLAHKGNCRFCAERRKQEVEALVEQIKEK